MIKVFISNLSTSNRNCLHMLLHLLICIGQNKNYNNFGYSDIATIFTPIVCKEKNLNGTKLMKLLLSNYSSIFEKDYPPLKHRTYASKTSVYSFSSLFPLPFYLPLPPFPLLLSFTSSYSLSPLSFPFLLLPSHSLSPIPVTPPSLP